MPKSENQKQKLLYIAKYLMDNTDENHAVSTPQLIEFLNSQGIKAERKSIYTDLRDLYELGIEVEGEKIGNKYHYHVVSRSFELCLFFYQCFVCNNHRHLRPLNNLSLYNS